MAKFDFKASLMGPMSMAQTGHIKGDKHIKYGIHFLGTNFLFVTRHEYEKKANQLEVIAKKFSPSQLRPISTRGRRPVCVLPRDDFIACVYVLSAEY